MTIRDFFTLLLCIVLVVMAGCSYPPDEPEPETGSYLSSYEALTGSAIPVGYLARQIVDSQYPGFDDPRLQDVIRFDVHVYKISYKTTYKGNETMASGAVVIPVTEEVVPVLSYHHGTMFLDSRVPSRFTNVLEMDAEMALNLLWASTGFVCSVPDYLGYGESGDILHPFHHAGSTATASLDMLRAVKELCSILDVTIKNQYYLTGYSEGGYATLALQKEIETNHPGEFPLIASSAGAGAYDLHNTVLALMDRETLRIPAYPCFLLTAYIDVYGWERDLREIFREPYRELIENGLLKGDYTFTEIDGQLTHNTAELLTASLIEEYKGGGEQQFKNAFIENSLFEGWTPSIPTRLYHGTADETVPAVNSVTAEHAFIINGAANVKYYPLEGSNHDTGIFPWVKETILWFDSLR
ncbi:MAG: hypothetical protein GY757_38785 [bacterium]|nr:hypothetical protein [bacterium]